MILSCIKIFGAAFGLGFAASAPLGPVNMIAIQRGVSGRWTHTLYCGIGAAIVDVIYFAIVLAGGKNFIEFFRTETVQDVMCMLGFALLVPLGFIFLLRAKKITMRSVVNAKRAVKKNPPAHLVTDVITGMGLTVINPAAPIYWAISGTIWLQQTDGAGVPYLAWWGLIAATAGMMAWFSILTVLVRFMPSRIGPKFHKGVNIFCGLLLLGFGGFCAVKIFLRHF